MPAVHAINTYCATQHRLLSMPHINAAVHGVLGVFHIANIELHALEVLGKAMTGALTP